jgi:serine protease inhibitor
MKSLAMRRPSDEFNLVFDRPFVVVIADETNGTILFLGIIGKP